MSTSINGTTGIDVSAVSSSAITADRTSTDGTIIDLQKDGSSVGSIGANGGRVYTAGPSYGAKFGNVSLDPCTSTGSTADNAYDLGGSSVRWKNLYLSGGVYVGGTGSANYLGDYEEGTFQTNLSPATSGTITIQSTADTLAYTKIGRLVTITGMISVTSTGSAVGSFVLLNNLPFTSADLTEFAGRGAGYVVFDDDSAGTRTPLGTFMLESSTQMRMYINAATVAGSDNFNVSFSYTTT